MGAEWESEMRWWCVADRLMAFDEKVVLGKLFVEQVIAAADIANGADVAVVAKDFDAAGGQVATGV